MQVDAGDLIAGFYEAAFDPSLFPEAVGQLGRFASADGAGLLVWDARAGEPALMVPPIDMGTDAAEAYCRHYVALDPFRPVIETLPAGTWSPCSAFFDERFVARDAFYNEYLIPRGTRYMAAARIVDGGDFHAYVGVHRGPHAPIERAELERLERVGRQLGRAITLYLAMTRSRLGTEAGAPPLERLSHPALLVDAAGRVLYANTAGEALLAARQGVGTERGRLRAGADTERLERLIAAAIGERLGGEVQLASTGDAPRAVMVTPAGPVPTLYGLAPVAVALLVFDAPPAASLKARFGLTRAEAALAQGLADGKRLADIATARRVSIETVRTQLRGLFRKTGARRQPDLVRILLAAHDKPAGT